MSSSLRIALLISALAGAAAMAVAATPPPKSTAPTTKAPASKSATRGSASTGKATPQASYTMPEGVAPKAKELLESVGHAYGDCSSYQFEGASAMAMSAQEVHQNVAVPFRLAAVKPSKVRAEIMNPQMSYVTVSDGSETWAYVPQIGQYTRKQAVPLGDAATNAQLGAMLASGTPIQRYLSPTDGLLAARLLGDSKVKVNGSTVMCHVVQAQYQAPDNGQVQMSPNTFWIDPATHLVVRDSLQMKMTNQNGMPVRLDAVTTYRIARINQPVADSLFTFTPPASAKLVDQIDVPGATEPASPLVGHPAEEIALNDLAGRAQKLSGLKGRVVLLDFWATWCGPCRRELPTIVKLHKELTAQGLSVVAVNVGEDAGTVKQFLASNKYELPVWLDPNHEAASAYGAQGIPTLVVIDRNGTVIDHKVGLHDEAALRAMLKKAGL